MNRKNKTIDIETLAAKAKVDRQEACNKELGAAIINIAAKHNCRIQMTFQIGAQLIPVDQVISFPTVLIAVAKDPK